MDSRSVRSTPDQQRAGGLWDVQKPLEIVSIERRPADPFAERVLAEHNAATCGQYGQNHPRCLQYRETGLRGVRRTAEPPAESTESSWFTADSGPPNEKPGVNVF